MTYRCVDWSIEKAIEREKKGKNAKDPYIESFAKGCSSDFPKNYLNEDHFDVTSSDKTPCVFRGLGKTDLIWGCINNDIDYLYIDTGYMGNAITKKYHRIAYNNLQTLNHLKPQEVKDRIYAIYDGRQQVASKVWVTKRPILRWNLKVREPHEKKKILIVPPSQKVFNHFGGDAKKYTKNLINAIKEISNRDIEVRKKLSRAERINFSLPDQLRKGKYHCIVTFNSIASVEAVSMGVPAVVLGPNAGSYLSENDLRNIDKPYYPNIEDLFDHLDYLKWCQFTGEEMRLDYTHKVIEALQGDEKPLKFKISEDFNV